MWSVTVRPWTASGGSSVHDETIRYPAQTAYEAIMRLYAANEYDFSEFRVIDVQYRAK